MNFNIIKTTTPRKHTAEDQLGFGRVFSDHMFVMEYNVKKGWHSHRIEPFAPYSFLPSMITFHYSQSIFEGLKAFRTVANEIVMFRPMMYLNRMNRSAKRLAIPPIDTDLVLNAIMETIKIDKDWVPKSDGTSLYIRPNIFASDDALGVRAASNYMCFVILSPVGPYYSEGFNPTKIYISHEYTRTVKGGLGSAKTGANYAASILASEEAKKEGFTQVLWLDGINMEYIQEIGTTNIFFVIDNKVVTPAIDDGTILPGITRDTVLQLLKDWNIPVEQRRVSVNEILEAQVNGKLNESFGTGTAAVVSPIGVFRYKDKDYTVADGKVGNLSNKLYSAITEILYGKTADTHNWLTKVCPG